MVRRPWIEEIKLDGAELARDRARRDGNARATAAKTNAKTARAANRKQKADDAGLVGRAVRAGGAYAVQSINRKAAELVESLEGKVIR